MSSFYLDSNCLELAHQKNLILGTLARAFSVKTSYTRHRKENEIDEKKITVIGITNDCHKIGEHMAHGDSLASRDVTPACRCVRLRRLDSFASQFQL